MVRRHANTDTRFSIDNQPLLPRAARGTKACRQGRVLRTTLLGTAPSREGAGNPPNSVSGRGIERWKRLSSESINRVFAIGWEEFTSGAVEARRLVALRDRWLNPPEWVEWVDEPVPSYPERVVPRDEDAAKALKKRTLTNLYNARPQWLADAHAALDAAVATAYGWRANISDGETHQGSLVLNGGIPANHPRERGVAARDGVRSVVVAACQRAGCNSSERLGSDGFCDDDSIPVGRHPNLGFQFLLFFVHRLVQGPTDSDLPRSFDLALSCNSSCQDSVSSGAKSLHRCHVAPDVKRGCQRSCVPMRDVVTLVHKLLDK